MLRVRRVHMLECRECDQVVHGPCCKPIVLSLATRKRLRPDRIRHALAGRECARCPRLVDSRSSCHSRHASDCDLFASLASREPSENDRCDRKNVSTAVFKPTSFLDDLAFPSRSKLIFVFQQVQTRGLFAYVQVDLHAAVTGSKAPHDLSGDIYQSEFASRWSG